MSSRKDEIKTVSSMMGNAAAHRALFGANAFTMLEATLYEGQAELIAQVRTWNDEEIVRLTARTKREARNIIKRRKKDWHDNSYDLLCFIADRETDKFIKRIRERQNKQGRE